MGKLLIFVILAVTIPRWAATLAQVDKFGVTVLGNFVAIAAIGEAIVLEFGNLYVLRQFTRCRQHSFEYHAAWEALDKSNQERDKPVTTRKPPYDPRIQGFKILPVALLSLECLTVLAQTPFIAGTLMGVEAISLLNQWGMWAVWSYAFLLVISPGVMTIAIGFSQTYDQVMGQIDAEKAKREVQPPRRRRIADAFTALLEARIGRPVAEHEASTARSHARPIGDQPTSGLPLADQWSTSDRPAGTDGGNGRAQSDQPATTDRAVAEQSEAMAAHLADLQERVIDQMQSGRANHRTFRRQDVEDILNLSRSHALNVIAYGIDHGILEQPNPSQYRYRFRIPIKQHRQPTE